MEQPGSPHVIQVDQGGVVREATVAWRSDGLQWVVTVELPEVGTVEERADDAFEALCRMRERLEPDGWRIGVAGAQVDVWPSGMARDQGGGLRAYRLTAAGPGGLVDTFEPVDPRSVTTVADQQATAERLLGGRAR